MKIMQGQNKSGDWSAYRKRLEAVSEQARQYDEQTIQGKTSPIYKFDHNVLGGEDLDYHSEHIGVPGFSKKVNLNYESPYCLDE